jgi:hypothetical protein
MKRPLGSTRYVVLGSLFAAAILFLSGFLQIAKIAARGARALTDSARVEAAGYRGHPFRRLLLDRDGALHGQRRARRAVRRRGEPTRSPQLAQDHEPQELKDRLIGVVVTVLAVTFLGIAADWTGDDVLPFGLAPAAVIIALGVFGWLAHGSREAS